MSVCNLSHFCRVLPVSLPLNRSRACNESAQTDQDSNSVKEVKKKESDRGKEDVAGLAVPDGLLYPGQESEREVEDHDRPERQANRFRERRQNNSRKNAESE